MSFFLNDNLPCPPCTGWTACGDVSLNSPLNKDGHRGRLDTELFQASPSWTCASHLCGRTVRPTAATRGEAGQALLLPPLSPSPPRPSRPLLQGTGVGAEMCNLGCQHWRSVTGGHLLGQVAGPAGLACSCSFFLPCLQGSCSSTPYLECAVGSGERTWGNRPQPRSPSCLQHRLQVTQVRLPLSKQLGHIPELGLAGVARAEPCMPGCAGPSCLGQGLRPGDLSPLLPPANWCGPGELCVRPVGGRRAREKARKPECTNGQRRVLQ